MAPMTRQQAMQAQRQRQAAYARQRAPAPGKRTALVQRQKNLVRRLEAEKRDQAIAQKAMVSERMAEDLVVDPLTGETFKEIRITLTESDFTLGANAANQTTIIASYTVPNGIALYFRGVKSEVDRNAPYLYGQLAIAGPTPINGTLRIRVYDASLNDLKGQPFTGSSSQLNAASPTNWYERLFFNSVKPVRANPGDRVVMDFTSASVVNWAPGVSYFTLHLIQLTKQF